MLVSAAMHLLVILGSLITWSHFFHSASEGIPPIVPVELVSLGEETNIAPMTREDLTLPEADKSIPPAPPPADAPKFEMKLFPKKTQPDPQPARKAFDRSGTNTTLPENMQPSRGPKDARLGDQDIKGFGDQNAMTMNLPDYLRNQILHCWHPIAGRPGEPVLSFELFFNPDGSVSQPPRLASTAPMANPDFLVIAESIRHAIYTCAPYRLPASRYSEWRNITLTFDLRLSSP
jgi:hypothetical protein